MSRSDVKLVALFVVTFAAGSAISYLLALAGEPQSVWVWRDVLGVLR